MIRAYVRACHPMPTLVVTLVVTALAWSIGWRGAGLVGILLAVGLGQLSVGWSNDAVDARADARADRRSKPTVSGALTGRSLWAAAVAALALSVLLSWAVAGWIGGSFHVLGVAMGWTYNLVLSRTVWSWLPYLIAFGSLPAFLTFGLDGSPPAAWLVIAFGVIGVSAHLANALRDVESDQELGLGGVVSRLGERRATALGWVLLGLGTVVIAGEAWRSSEAAGIGVLLAFLAALVVATRSSAPSAMFTSLLGVVVLDVVLVVVLASGDLG